MFELAVGPHIFRRRGGSAPARPDEHLESREVARARREALAPVFLEAVTHLRETAEKLRARTAGDSQLYDYLGSLHRVLGGLPFVYQDARGVLYGPRQEAHIVASFQPPNERSAGTLLHLDLEVWISDQVPPPGERGRYDPPAPQNGGVGRVIVWARRNAEAPGETARDQLMSTLVHEMTHAMSWLFNDIESGAHPARSADCSTVASPRAATSHTSIDLSILEPNGMRERGGVSVNAFRNLMLNRLFAPFYRDTHGIARGARPEIDSDDAPGMPPDLASTWGRLVLSELISFAVTRQTMAHVSETATRPSPSPAPGSGAAAALPPDLSGFDFEWYALRLFPLRDARRASDATSSRDLLGTAPYLAIVRDLARSRELIELHAAIFTWFDHARPSDAPPSTTVRAPGELG
ncbi:MAG: hypothetical protein JWM10_3163 [Myxococcaceae bacterium]|nr:hypothetical protein [Myxococcaceae bacterium]